jgi:hypothetical protein
VKLGAILCGGLLVVAAADSALARPHKAGQAAAARTATPPRKARAARPIAPALATYVPAPKRTTPPALALRPDFSEGEWGQMAMRGQLSPNDLAGASVAMNSKAKFEAVQTGATLSKLRDRQLQDAPALATSSLDQPLSQAAPEHIEMPIGFDLSKLGFTIRQTGD